MRAVLVALVMCFAAPALAADKPEPKYEGKPLDYWVVRFQKADTTEQRQAAAEAIKAFGAGAAPAVPALIAMLSDLSPTYREQVIDILGALGPIAKDARPVIVKLRKEKKIEGNIDAFIAICPEPKEAVPYLVQLLGDPDDDYYASYAFFALCKIGPSAKDALPAIRRYVLNKLAEREKDKGQHSTISLTDLSGLGKDVVPLLVEMLNVHGGFGREDALTSLENLGPNAIKASPAIIKLLKHDDPKARYRAAVVLWKLEKNPAVVSVLTELLKTDPEVVFGVAPLQEVKSNLAATAAQMLGEIGPDAKTALPQLREAAARGWTVWLITAGGTEPYLRELRDAPEVARLPRFISPKEVAGWAHITAVIDLGQAATEAIDKIEGKSKK